MKYNDATNKRPDGERVLNDRSVKIDIAANVKEIINEETWGKNDRNSITVFKNSVMTIVLMALQQMAEMQPREAEGTMCMQVLEGTIEVVMEGNIETIYDGELLAINKGNFYSVKALEKTIVLLTVAGVE
ncbi:MAG: hypothetical protein H7257_11930 [Taibaiella sp.]|nr:hypothetical protein [Taibaiella sp.]